MAHSFSFQGYVVGQKEVGECDTLVYLLTQKRGKILAKARGLRKISSKRQGTLQTGNLVQGKVHQTNNFYTLGDLELLSTPLSLRKDLVALGMVLTMSELINKLVPEDQADGQVFDLFDTTIKTLGKKVEVQTMINFEVQLLDYLGYGLPQDIKEALEKKDLKKAQAKLWQYLTTITERKMVGVGKILA